MVKGGAMVRWVANVVRFVLVLVMAVDVVGLVVLGCYGGDGFCFKE